MNKINNFISAYSFIRLFVFIFIVIFPPSSFAQTASPTPSASPTPAKEIIESAQERLKKAVQEKSDEAKKVLGAKNRIALIGKIKDITSSAITIQLKSGSTRMAAITDQTVILRNGKSAKPNELAIGDFIIAMGYADVRDSLDAKRVVASTIEPESRKTKIIWGKVTKINPDKNTFSITTNRPAELGGTEAIELSAVKTAVDLTKLNLENKIIVITIPGKTDKQQVAKAVKLVK
ncbi:hypothetical protein HYU89_00880 [Candidatus Collierbacteria bacterium]|nr:hypothetical protein [Candidatus Collierbacteria bacterium]